MLRRRGYFIPFVDVHLRSGEHVSGTVVISDLAPTEGEQGFREVIFATAHSLHQVLH
jgi:hypothetical protein